MVDAKRPSQPAAPEQAILDLGIEIQRNVNGIEMGVLENGIPFLTQTGLANLSGISRSVVFDIGQDWEGSYDDGVIQKDRIGWLKSRLFSQGYKERKLFIETKRDNAVNNAYPDMVCMAVLEYYAFEAKNPNSKAVASFRSLAAFGLQKYIYDSLNYRPVDQWHLHHERVSLLKNSPPDGHWIVFNEIDGLIVDLINAGLTVNSKVIPDISVGQVWAAKWEEEDYQATYGIRTQFLHNYPPSFAQSASNPQLAWAYPDSALSEFRRWFRHEYLTTRFPRYILTKAKLLPGGKDEAAQIGSMYQPKEISSH